MNPATAFVLVTCSAALATLATWALCILADDPPAQDPPAHCPGCTCRLPRSHVRLRPPAGAAVLYDYEQDTV